MVQNTDTLPYRGTSAGGGYTTVNDLLGFANAITGHKLLDAKHTDLLRTGKTETPMGKYGDGFDEDSSAPCGQRAATQRAPGLPLHAANPRATN